MRHHAGADPLPFTFQGYTLYTKEVEVRPGVRRRLWFFAKQPPKSALPAAKPDGFRVAVAPLGGVPFLRPEAPWTGGSWPPRKNPLHPHPAAGHKAS
jgi:hypothetical protein